MHAAFWYSFFHLSLTCSRTSGIRLTSLTFTGSVLKNAAGTSTVGMRAQVIVLPQPMPGNVSADSDRAWSLISPLLVIDSSLPSHWKLNFPRTADLASNGWVGRLPHVVSSSHVSDVAHTWLHQLHLLRSSTPWPAWKPSASVLSLLRIVAI